MASGPSVLKRLRLRSDPTVDTDGDYCYEPASYQQNPEAPTEAVPRSLTRFPMAMRLRRDLLPTRHNSVASSTSSLSPFKLTAVPAGATNTKELGLQLVCDTPSSNGNIIFVHGLGGSAWKTWSWNRDVANFWPDWLADEEDLASFRIFTFGYDSNWKGAGANLNISDFAKDLLLQMLTFGGEDRPSLAEGNTIFVAHSMGGLVVKKAFLLAKMDQQYHCLATRMTGMVFLGTPHRGANSATILNNILAALPLGPPPKAYVADLQIQSNTLHEINEQFRHHCQELALVSYFETQKTSLGYKEVLIVEKESAILQCPGELSSPLYANHHTICKFESRMDPKYTSVKNTICYLAKGATPSTEPALSTLQENNLIESILGVHDSADDDLKAVSERLMDGSYNWISQHPNLIRWRSGAEEDQSSSFFWIFGLPATGKSSLTSVIVNNIRQNKEDCQFHFFSGGHQMKKTSAYCLRSIAAQLARCNAEFRAALFAFHAETGISFTSQDQKFHVIWDKIFKRIIFKMKFRKPLYWVLDAVDEADTKSALINALMTIRPASRINILFTSRPMSVPSSPSALPVSTLFLSDKDTEGDMRLYVTNTVSIILPVDDGIRAHITKEILTKASGSFLWVRLALDSLRDNWHTTEDIRKALSDLPVGMMRLYAQMLDRILAQPERTQSLAQRILSWVACSWRPLTVEELRLGLQPEFTGFLNFEDTVNQVCGHFVSINNGRISMIHATARQFLTNEHEGCAPFIPAARAHSDIAIRCLGYLSDERWRRIFRAFSPDGSEEPVHEKRRNRLLLAEQGHALLGYSACYWAYHVSKSPVHSKSITRALRDFFTRYCLSWIEALALSGNLRYLIRSAKFLKVYAKRRRSACSRVDTSPVLETLSPKPEDDPKWLQAWATDIIRIVGKFGPNLVSNPATVHSDIPPFCPQGSLIKKTYAELEVGLLSVAGVSSEDWDDRLASVTVGEDYMASKVLATEAYFITLVSSVGMIMVWYSDTCLKARTIECKEYVPHMTLNASGTQLATAGLTAYTVWELATGAEVCRIPKTTETRALAINFGHEGSTIYVGSDDCSIAVYDIHTSNQLSHLSFEPPSLEYDGCPRSLDISPDCTAVAMAWRGKPPLIWHFEPGPYQATRIRKVRQPCTSLCAPEILRWLPDSATVFVLCQDTNFVEWRIYDDQQIAYPHLQAREFELSNDGNLVITADSTGTVSVWSLPRLSLLYKLVSENDFVRDVSFSPDNQRLYDIRGSFCNIWEPDVLVRPDDQDMDDQSTDEVSFMSSEPTTSHTKTNQALVTAVAVTSSDAHYCCGRDDGSVIIHEAVTGKGVRKVYGHAATSAVLKLYWSDSGRFIASSDDSARVIVKRLAVKEEGKWAVFPVLDVRIDEPVEQFLCSPDESYLLISTASTNHVYELRSKSCLCMREWGSVQQRHFINHPLDPGNLIWLDSGVIKSYSWAALEEEWSADVHFEEEADDYHQTIVWATSDTNTRHIIYGTLAKSLHRTHSLTLTHNGLHLASLYIASCPTSTEIQADPLPVPKSCCLKKIFGTYKGSLVFLNQENQVCTLDIDVGGSEGLMRHFSLPRDWLDLASLEAAVVNSSGTLFYPRVGSVAIVRNGFRNV
ncbi:hypothetical protein M011DRAFT_487132 [Sporormia fimetaria CBS 119925]|uniref:GPI inositol-deacylase n=1 Tax=Sporormia fimetaria CBS 119925 TaxID=1340428 RepID=A0A6A6VAK3_9PLEO|nr:hypothetical protein M011DRAFT_487132 [Sporormia fimetaria CBS 119925]